MEKSSIKIYKSDIVTCMLGFFVIAALLLFTNPQRLPAVMFLLMPICIALTSYAFIKVVMEIFTNLSKDRVRILSVVIASAPTIIIVLGSLGQLGIQDLLLATLLSCGLGWYIKRQSVFNNQ